MAGILGNPIRSGAGPRRRKRDATHHFIPVVPNDGGDADLLKGGQAVIHRVPLILDGWKMLPIGAVRIRFGQMRDSPSLQQLLARTTALRL